MFQKYKQKKKPATTDQDSNGRYVTPIQFLNRSLSRKLFVSMVVLFALSALGVMLLGGKIISRSAKKNALQHLQVVADNKMRLLEMWLEERLRLCAELAESVTTNDDLQENLFSKTNFDNLKYSVLPSALESRFRQFLKYHNEYRQILILDQDKKQVVAMGMNGVKHTSDLSQSVDLILFLESLSESKVSDPFPHPITGEPTGVVGAKLHTQEGRFIAYLIMEIDFNHLNVLFHQFDLGETGETYLVNKRRVLITQSRFEERDKILRLRVSTEGVESAFNNSYAKGKYKDYRGVEVLGVYRYVPGMDWVLAAKVDKKEALSLESSMRKASLLPVIVAFFVMLLVMQIILKRYLSPLHELKKQMTTIGKGDFRGQIAIDSYDEIGQLAGCFNKMNDALTGILLKLQELMRKFKGSISQIGISLDEHDQAASQQAISIKQTAESLDELNQSAGNVLNNAREVQTRVEETMLAILNLSSKADEIKEISSSIDDVSVKINLLSLNASIEAARAGEHGRGFGVVAGEIRKLAENTNELTERITTMIADIQKLIQSSMFSGEVMVSEVRQIGLSVEQQTSGTSQIATAIEAITESTLQSAKGASEISNSVSELQDMAQQIHALFQRFQLDDSETNKNTESEDAIIVHDLDNERMI